MGAARFLSGLGAGDGGHRAGHEVFQLERFHQVAVPHERAVGDLNVGHLAGDDLHLLDAFGQRLVGPEDGGVLLHGLLHLETQLGRGDRALGVAQTVEPRECLVDRGLRRVAVGRGRIDDLARANRRRAAEDHEVDQRVRPEPVRPVDRGAARLAHRHQAGRHAVGILGIRIQHFAPVIRGDAAHIVVNRRQNRDRFFRQVDAREDPRRFRDAGQPQRQRLGRQVVEVQVDVILVRADAAAFADLHRHAARHHIARRKVLVGRRVPLHEALAFRVGQVAPLAARAFGDQAARAVDPRRVELHEFHVLQRQSGARHHAVAVAGAGMRRGRAEIGPAIAARGQHRHLRVELVQRAVIQFPRENAGAFAVFRHQQVDGEILDVELRFLFQRAAIKRVQDRMARPVRRGAGALHGRAFAELGRVAAERALIDLAFFGAREGHAVMFQLIDRIGGRAGEVFHGIRVAQPVRPLDGVVHVPLPVVGAHVAQAGGDPALGGDRVRAGRENLGDAGRFQPLLGHAECRAQTGPAGAHDHHVISMLFDFVCRHWVVLRR
eukprot:m.14606 g.14606  ORF g.14606 m.14606 type:complete len:550 (+) comp7649_c2_seq1:323-1972(+)